MIIRSEPWFHQISVLLPGRKTREDTFYSSPVAMTALGFQGVSPESIRNSYRRKELECLRQERVLVACFNFRSLEDKVGWTRKVGKWLQPPNQCPLFLYLQLHPGNPWMFWRICWSDCPQFSLLVHAPTPTVRRPFHLSKMTLLNVLCRPLLPLLILEHSLSCC